MFEQIASVENIHFCKADAQNTLVKILACFYTKVEYKNTALLKNTYKTVSHVNSVGSTQCGKMNRRRKSCI